MEIVKVAFYLQFSVMMILASDALVVALMTRKDIILFKDENATMYPGS